MSEEDDYDVLFIAIEYQGRSYMGAMGFESPALCLQISILLESCIVFGLKRSAPSIYRKIDRTGEQK